jgi:hypothetical protein
MNTEYLVDINIVSDQEYGKIIKVKFPYNDSLIEVIHKYGLSVIDSVYVGNNSDFSTWHFSFHEKNIEFLTRLMAKEKFQVPMEFTEYVAQIEQIHDSLEKYVPMLCLEDGRPVLKNCAKSVPTIDTDDVLEAIFLARRYGITTFDTGINDFVNGDSVGPIVRTFLKSDYTDTLKIDSEKHDFLAIADIVKFMSPCLIVIPGGSEYDKIKDSYRWLTEMGIKSQEMSAMFRLPSVTGGKFNHFVKNNGLNSPIGEHTKIVFVSGKMSQPVIKSKIKFRCVINLGYNNAHHTMRDFLKNHENTIYYSKTHKKTGAHFGNL